MNMFYINQLVVCTVLRLGMGGKEEDRHCETEMFCLRMKIIEFTSRRVEIYCPKNSNEEL